MRRAVFVCLLLSSLVTGCAGWLTPGEPPEVLVTNLAPLDGTPFEQRLQVDLRIRNPNDYELQVTGVDLRMDLNGKRFARGLGNKEFTVPRLGESVVTLETSTSMLDIVRQVLALRRSSEWSYAISGVLYLQRGRLPFEHTGLLLGKEDLSGIQAPP